MDEDNGLWTLNYLPNEKNTGIIELINGSDIYVKKFVLVNIQETRSKQTRMARSLMKLVFKEKALYQCSLKGKTANGKGKHEDCRPGLFQDGVTAILAYTRSWAKKITGSLWMIKQCRKAWLK